MESAPFIVGVGGFTSNVGKTSLMCELLRAFPGWEAIKTTRGHYRSCGKDPETCCVSHLLQAEPLIRSGRGPTYELGKDTGRYWDAGAANVHWLIATDDQIDQGIHEALGRVSSSGVFIEGNSFSQFIRADYFVMVKNSLNDTIKKSARAVMPQVSALFIYGPPSKHESITPVVDDLINGLPVFAAPSLPLLIADLRAALGARLIN